ncbi:hypothetical protein V491_04482 [Pseudogymnoascus sp. VKM F-3775]|nr:hypothetical protein V491_04482 [Pseudogymnoascus sp. VKM F-3775]
MAGYTKQTLTSGWEFKQVGANEVPEWTCGFLPVAQFPTNVHLDLMAHDKIPDPFIGLNEYKVQWVGEQQWLYRTKFECPSVLGQKTVLQFDGLDTFATVSLNGTKILEAENMHRIFRADITGTVKQGANVLEIQFDSAIIRGKQLMKETGFKPVGFTSSTDKSRLLVRKAQYHYAWNWGPELTTCGPWRPIHLEQYSARISDLHAKVDISIADKTSSISISAEIECAKDGDIIRYALTGPDGASISTSSIKVTENKASDRFEVQDAKFWWPVGFGEQPLYTVDAQLIREGINMHQQSRKMGLRTVSLVQRPLIDQPGTSFFFEVNNVPIFSSGSNWCPADHFAPRVSPERYRTLLQMVVDGNQNMLRVWGGAIYEDDVFYDICDELGILVWNDFMFACGTYPADEDFRSRITEEVEDNIKRLRHHPSIVAWSGNNEDYLFAELFHTTYDIKDSDPENWLKTTFPARYIYEKMLPEICKRLIPDTPYHPGSPWGGKYFNDPTIGDTHMWEVWHHVSRPWQEYPKLGSRFISEFGISSLPHLDTIESFLIDSPPSERHPNSRTIDHHNKELQHERKMATYLVENFKYGFGLEEYIYITQLNQAEAMTCALRAWRREWKGTGKEYCGGSLIWQFNPTWQVTSKALVDYFNRPKMSYFTVKRDIAPISLGMERKEIKTPRSEFTRAFIDTKTRILGWATNVTLKPVSYLLTIKAFELSTGKELFSQTKAQDLGANVTTELFDIELPRPCIVDEPVIMSTCLQTEQGTIIARCTNWPQPYRYINIPKPKLVIGIDGDKISARANVPVKGLAFYVKDVDAVNLEDNMLDLVPGDVQEIVAHGLNGKAVTWRYYGME